jgi:hypothetical protein
MVQLSTLFKLSFLCIGLVYFRMWIQANRKEIFDGIDLTAQYLNHLPTTLTGTTSEAESERRRRERYPYPKFRILCTSDRGRVQWGSYKLRCRDWNDWIKKCANRNVRMTVGVPIETYYKQGPRNETTSNPYFNVTVSTKVVPKTPLLPQFGKFYVDLVDDYVITDKKVPKGVHLILQTEWQGRERFRTHNSTAVEHWYNSYPDDMFREDPEEVPPVRVLAKAPPTAAAGGKADGDDESSTLRLATIWNTLAKDTKSGCPSAEGMTNVRYDCIEQEFDILDWYGQVDKSPDAADVVRRYTENPSWGTGRLYYHLFRKYDVMVVPAKDHPMKLKYGNVQRAVSQMRSGVPVLLEVWGEVMEDFMSRYGYKCAFARHEMTGKFRPYGSKGKNVTMTKASFWTWEQAVEELRKPEVRRECQKQGLRIVKDYSPTAIGKKFLRAVGYDGPFEC